MVEITVFKRCFSGNEKDKFYYCANNFAEKKPYTEVFIERKESIEDLVHSLRKQLLLKDKDESSPKKYYDFEITFLKERLIQFPYPSEEFSFSRMEGMSEAEIDAFWVIINSLFL